MNSLSITWSPPSFYSIDIPKGSIPTYHIYVKSKDSSLLVNINTTDTFYNGFSNNFTICDIYTVTVTAFIEQYTSIDVSSTKEYSGSKLHNITKKINYAPSKIIQLKYKLIL